MDKWKREIAVDAMYWKQLREDTKKLKETMEMYEKVGKHNIRSH